MRGTSLQTEDPSEIRESFVARLLMYGPDTPYKKCIFFDGSHDQAVYSRGLQPPPEINSKNGDFSFLPSEQRRVDCRNRSIVVTLHWQSALGFF